ncbi:hypothetical protein L208DRAFT_1401213 [Tricholoma matsutake]|nr:hypothetical protein L208DRAFT_1401213 [Tricholoma matsutake 945]
MESIESKRHIELIPCATKKIPPYKYLRHEYGAALYRWFITEDEYLRLSKLFGRDFQEAGVSATNLFGPPVPCDGCGKYTEFIDWVWTALNRGVHSADFIFVALQNQRQGKETMHDAYCSACGVMISRSRNNAEGGEPDIFLAGVSSLLGLFGFSFRPVDKKV